MKQKLKQRLIRARERLSDHRCWIKGTAYLCRSDRDCYCLWGALFFNPPHSSLTLSNDEYVTLEKHVRAAIIALGYAHKSIPEWNDEPSRKFSHIINVLDRAIETVYP